MIVVFDSDCTSVMARNHEKLSREMTRLDLVEAITIATTMIVYGEKQHGLANQSMPPSKRIRMMEYLKNVLVLNITSDAPKIYGQLCFDLTN